MRNSVKEKGIAGKLSTKAETEAWKQAEGNADQKHLEGHREAGKGRREKKKRKAE